MRLLSLADDEAPEIPSDVLPEGEHYLCSPDVLVPHPGARETDPFFSTTRQISQDEAEETTNPGHSFKAPAPPPSAWLADTGSARSAHMLQAPGTRPDTMNLIRRNSSQSSSGPRRKKPTRSDSGREFWGLPEAPRRHKSLLSRLPVEDSSEDEEDGEVVSDLHWRALLTVISRGICQALVFEGGKRILPPPEFGP